MHSLIFCTLNAVHGTSREIPKMLMRMQSINLTLSWMDGCRLKLEPGSEKGRQVTGRQRKRPATTRDQRRADEGGRRAREPGQRQPELSSRDFKFTQPPISHPSCLLSTPASSATDYPLQRLYRPRLRAQHRASPPELLSLPITDRNTALELLAGSARRMGRFTSVVTGFSAC